MPIFEFACDKCRRVFSFLARRSSEDRLPKCPKCGSRRMSKLMSGFAMLKGGARGEDAPGSEDGGIADGAPDFDDAKVDRVMSELERDMDHLDENNPRHVAHLMKRMKEIMPEGSAPKELDIAIRRLEKGEDPEKVEADMGDVLGGMFGGGEGGEESGGGAGAYSRDPGLYDY